MCWSAPVSLAFSFLDLFFISFLLQRRRGRDVTYASLLMPIAVQEIFQFLIWSTGAALHPGDTCTRWKAALAAGTFVVPMAVPVTMAWRSFADRSFEGCDDAKSARMRVLACGFSAAAFVLALFACILTGNFCVKVGPRHHQVWICSSMNEAWGYPGYFFDLFLYAVAMRYGIRLCTVFTLGLLKHAVFGAGALFL